ncbi:hypothetical protein H7347_00575 [Corynebacterium sp. zg-331]|uniref:hypothetical protein n=1 Tax=unclassified Corynebacterium TaxID=2624378 RepID=UPI00128C2348|nr:MULTISPECIES: hypothetical protein [unclassified Corynebacterium]MBC3185088.1 hypothetical protein [Corynebacterium sp. zg-331]MPV51587.1 hypothetical protein [Corynebacterium sp. zg331]
MHDIQRRIEDLSDQVRSENFLPSLVRVLNDYQAALEEIKRRELSDVKEYTKLHHPTLSEPE